MEKIHIDAWKLARQMFSKRDFETAEILLFEHLKVNSLDHESHSLLAEVYEKQYRPELALRSYTSAQMIAEAQGKNTSHLQAEIKRLEAEAKTHQERKHAISEKEQKLAEKQKVDPNTASKNRPEYSDTIKLTRKIFPYLGFAQKKSETVLSNDYGYRLVEGFKGETLPYIPETGSNEFIVGVFGGSIASAFYQDSVAILTEKLNAHPDLGGCRVTVLNFAMSGSKQPESMIALAYFTSIGQKFDLVINVDGLNDLGACTSNLNAGHHIAMPPADITNVFMSLADIPTLNPEALRYFLRIANLDSKIARMEKGELSFLKMLGFLSKYKAQRTRLMADKPKPDPENNLIHVHSIKPLKVEQLNDDKFDQVLEDIADFWFTCIRNMVHLCRGLGITYVHSLHPSHFLMASPLSEADNELVRHAQVDYYRRLITIGFPKFAEKLVNITKVANNAQYCSLEEVMDSVGGDMLLDAICHLKPSVHVAMAERLADFVADINLKSD